MLEDESSLGSATNKVLLIQKRLAIRRGYANELTKLEEEIGDEMLKSQDENIRKELKELCIDISNDIQTLLANNSVLTEKMTSTKLKLLKGGKAP